MEDVTTAPEEKTPEASTSQVAEQANVAEPTEMAQLQERFTKLEQYLKGEQKASVKKDDTILRLTSDLDDAKTGAETNQALMAILASQKGQSEEELSAEVEANKPDLLAQFKTVKKTLDDTRVQDSYNKKADGVWNRLLAIGVQEGEDAFYEIQGMLSRGDIDWASSKVSKMEAGKKEPETPEAKETEGQMRERIKQELLRETSAFQTETGSPSGSARTFSVKEIVEMPDAEFLEHQATINKAQREGKIKK